MPENNVLLQQVMQRYTIYAPLAGVNKDFIAALLRAFEEKPFCVADFNDLTKEEVAAIFDLQKKLKKCYFS